MSDLLHPPPARADLATPSQAAGRARWVPVIVLALTGVGGALRVLALDSKGLWLDEAFSVWMGNQSLPDLYGWLLRIDQHPPLYYVLLHAWMGVFGDTAYAVRLLSALLGTLTIPVLFLLGRQLLGAGGGLIAATILTFAPFHVRFAQEARMYTLLALSATLALTFLARILTAPRPGPVGAASPSGAHDYAKATRWPAAGRDATRASLDWWGLILFTVAAMLSHNTALLFPLSLNVFVLGFIFWRRRRSAPAPEVRAEGPAQLNPPPLRGWLAAQAAVLLLWSPWFAAFLTQARGVYAEFWIPGPTVMSVAMAIGSFFSAHLPVSAGLIGLVTAAYGVLLALGAFYLRRSPALLVLLITLFAVPFGGELLVSLRRPIFYDRTLIYVTIPLYLLLAAGVLRLRRRALMAGALAGILIVSAVALANYYTHFEKEQWREAAATVAAEATPNDLLLFNATWVQIPFDFYFRDFGLELEERGAPVDLFERGILEPKMRQADVPQLLDRIRGRERVWLIYSHDWYTDPDGIIPTVLDREMRLLARQPFVGLEVRLYGAQE